MAMRCLAISASHNPAKKAPLMGAFFALGGLRGQAARLTSANPPRRSLDLRNGEKDGKSM